MSSDREQSRSGAGPAQDDGGQQGEFIDRLSSAVSKRGGDAEAQFSPFRRRRGGSRGEREGARSAVAALRYPPDDFKIPRFGNVLALLGPRGSGKTTVLVKVGEVLRGHESEVQQGERLRLFVSQPIDLALAQPSAPLGVSVLTELRRQVDYWLRRGRHPSEHGEPDDLGSDLDRAFESVSQAYFYADESFRDLLADRAATAAHYAESAARAIPMRFELPQLVYRWTEDLCRLLGVDALVVLLDDVDMVQSQELVRQLVRSLLDELHQPRLIFVLAADLPGLERASASGDAPRELALARAILLKILALQDRHVLPPWSADQRRGFRPRPRALAADAAHAAHEGDGSTPSPALHELVSRALRGSSSSSDLRESPSGAVLAHLDTGALLPAWPRGLENLYRLLDSTHQESEATGANRSSAAADRALRELLAAVARSRGEPRWATQLDTRPLWSWARTLDWRGEQAADSGDALALLAASAVRDEEPLWGIVPERAALPIDDEAGAAGDRERWHELMLDHGMGAGSVTPLSVVGRWPILDQALQGAGIGREYSIDALAASWVEFGPSRAELVWQEWTEREVAAGTLHVQVGLRGWLAGAARQRPFAPALLDRLYFFPQPAGSGQDADPFTALADVLPRCARGLVLLCHALRRLPWRRLSTRVDETPPGVLAVAGATWTAAGFELALAWAREGALHASLEPLPGGDEWAAPLASLAGEATHEPPSGVWGRADLPRLLEAWCARVEGGAAAPAAPDALQAGSEARRATVRELERCRQALAQHPAVRSLAAPPVSPAGS